ncbi:MAG: hypothetical protein V1809_15365 [Planctomycetota bacterium]
MRKKVFHNSGESLRIPREVKTAEKQNAHTDQQKKQLRIARRVINRFLEKGKDSVDGKRTIEGIRGRPDGTIRFFFAIGYLLRKIIGEDADLDVIPVEDGPGEW